MMDRPDQGACRSKLRARRPVRKLRQVGSTCDDADFDETSILKPEGRVVRPLRSLRIRVQGLKISAASGSILKAGRVKYASALS
jgi:hypothetical protein